MTTSQEQQSEARVTTLKRGSAPSSSPKSSPAGPARKADPAPTSAAAAAKPAPQSGPRPVRSPAAQTRGQTRVAQPVQGLVIAPEVAQRVPAAHEATPICASVEHDLCLSVDELVVPRTVA